MSCRRFPTIVMVLSAASGLFAQENRASLSGQVTDATGASVPNAVVKAYNQEQGASAETLTNDSGRYQIGFLEPGTYTVSIETAGFKKYIREQVELVTGQKMGLDVQLELGTQAESIRVTGEAPLLSTETAMRGQNVSSKELRDVPNNGQIFLQMVWAMAGVVRTTNDWGSMGAQGVANATSFSISGGRSGENEVLLDGVSDVGGDRQVKHIPNIETIEEFRVITNPYDAQYGRTGGGAISITTKSGTNLFHGAAWDYHRTSYASANSWSSNRLGLPISKRHSNSFGFVADGPVYIPKVINGKNRLFFMFTYQGVRNPGFDGATYTIPQAEQFSGDFSQLFDASGRPVTIYDPLTTIPDNRGGYVRTAFPGNKIPAGRLNPIAVKAASYYPKPSGAGDGPAHINNFNLPTPNHQNYNSEGSRMDWIVNDTNRLHFRYSNTPYEEIRVLKGFNNVAEPSANAPLTRNGVNWSVDWTSTLTPRAIFNLRFGLTRWEDFAGNTFGKGFDATQLGFPSSLVSQFKYLQFPDFQFSGTSSYGEIGTSRPGTLGKDYAYSLQPNINIVKGAHVLKVGAEFRRFENLTRSLGLISGQYVFSRAFTQANPLQADALSGNEFASFLLGYPASGTVDNNMDPFYRGYYYAAFVQDDWKVSPRLTLNIGFRYDYEAPLAERYNRMVRGFDFDEPSPIAAKVQGLTLKGGLLYAGTSGSSRQAFNRDYKHPQPRFGFAYRVGHDWVIRGGYGLLFIGQYERGANTGFSQPTPLTASTDGGLTPRLTLSNPFPEPLLQPIGSSRGAATNLGLNISAQYLDRPLPYAHEMSLGFQRQLRGGWVVESSYAANFTRRLPVSTQVDNLPVSQLGQVNAYYTTRVNNPMAGLLPDNPAKNGETIPRQDLLLPFPQYTGLTLTSLPIGRQDYHSVQNTISRRFAHGMSFQAAYTIGKTLEAVTLLNPQDFNLAKPLSTPLEKRVTQYDVPQKFAVLSTYELPFGRGKRFGGSMHPLLNGLVGGWQLNGNLTIQSGFPVDFPNAAPVAGRSAKLSDGKRNMYEWFDTSLWKDPATGRFVQAQAPFTLRNFPTRFPDVRFSDLKCLNASVFKDFPIYERLRFNVRLEAYNVTNTPWFSTTSAANLNVTSPTFGQLSLSSNNASRSFALYGRLTW
jgi:outer membrane receptor protein involved in Fe transport